MCFVRYTVDMSGNARSRIASRKPIGWVFAFVLSVTQVYPAFGACLCLHGPQETVEVSAPAEVAPSCRLAARQPAAREEMDCGSGNCAQEAGGGSSAGISRDECCGAGSAWTSPLPASLSRTVEVRPVFEAMPWSGSEDAGTLFPRFDRLNRGTEPGIHAGFSTTIYLLNASLLI